MTVDNDFDVILADTIAAIPDHQLLADLKQVIVNADRMRPRSQQRQLGPSGVDPHCQRRLAYALAASRGPHPTPEQTGHNRYSDPMPSIMGTALHSWLEDAVKADNQRLGYVRWIPEQQVEVRPGLTGCCDVYDLLTDTALDWKLLGAASYAKVLKHGVSHAYRVQRHLYGRGWVNHGLPVKYVGNVILCRAGSLQKIHLDREPYSDTFVNDVFTRIDDTEDLMRRYKVECDPAGFKNIPTTPDDDCEYCPWWSPTMTGPYSCGGKLDTEPRTLPHPVTRQQSTRPEPLPPVSAGTCERCRVEPGTRMIDPHLKEIGDIEKWVTLCQECRNYSIGNI